MESAPQSRCIDRAQRSDRFFCDLSADALQAFDQINQSPTTVEALFYFVKTRSPWNFLALSRPCEVIRDL